MGCSSGAPRSQHGGQSFQDLYRLDGKLLKNVALPPSRGTFAQVRVASCRATGKEFAVKIFDTKYEQAAVCNEGAALQIESHLRGFARHEVNVHTIAGTADAHNIARIQNAFLEDTLCYIVTDYCECNLYDCLQRVVVLTEKALGHFFEQMFKAVAHIHSVGVVHRDVRPINFGCSWTAGLSTIVKLCDFGLAQKMPREDIVKECVAGSPLFMSPEMLTNHDKARLFDGYSCTTDVWSLGVTSCVLLLGRFPYRPLDGRSLCRMKRMMRMIATSSDPLISAHLKLPCEHVSPSAMVLVRRLLTWDPTKRLSARLALEMSITDHLTEDSVCLRRWVQQAMEEGAFNEQEEVVDIGRKSKLEDAMTKFQQKQRLEVPRANASSTLPTLLGPPQVIEVASV